MGKFDTGYFVKNVPKIKQYNFSEMLNANCELESLYIDKKNSIDFFQSLNLEPLVFKVNLK